MAESPCFNCEYFHDLPCTEPGNRHPLMCSHPRYPHPLMRGMGQVSIYFPALYVAEDITYCPGQTKPKPKSTKKVRVTPTR